MTSLLLLLIRRAIVLALVLGLSYFTAFTLFPFLHAKIPFLYAAIVTYGLMAYLGVPAVIRAWRVFNRPNHVPHRATTGDGWALEPVTLAITAVSRRDFIWAMKKAGWHIADKHSVRNSIHEMVAMLLNRPYPTAPVSNLYLFGRKQDIAFQLPVGKSPRRRHHVRFWRVNVEPIAFESLHNGFWRTLFRRFWNTKLSLWVGAASYDNSPFSINLRTGQLTHGIDGAIDQERDYIIATLQEANVIKQVTEIRAGDPFTVRHEVSYANLISDGYVKLCEIKRQILPPPKR